MRSTTQRVIVFCIVSVVSDMSCPLWAAPSPRSATPSAAPSRSLAPTKKLKRSKSQVTWKKVHQVDPGAPSAGSRRAKKSSSSSRPDVTSPTTHAVSGTFNGSRIGSNLVSSIAPEAFAWAYCTDINGNKMNDCIAIYTYTEKGELIENIIGTTPCGTAGIQNDRIFVAANRTLLGINQNSQSLANSRINATQFIKVAEKSPPTGKQSVYSSGPGCFHNYLLARKTTYKTEIGMTENGAEYTVKMDLVFEVPTLATPLLPTELKRFMTGTIQYAGTKTKWGKSAIFYDADGVVVYNEAYEAIASGSSSSLDCDDLAEIVATAIEAFGDFTGDALKACVTIGITIAGAVGAGAGAGAAGGVAGSEVPVLGTGAGLVVGTTGGAIIGGVIGEKVGEALGDIGSSAVKNGATVVAAIAKPVAKKLCEDYTATKVDPIIPIVEPTNPNANWGGGGGGCAGTVVVTKTCTTKQVWVCRPSGGGTEGQDETLTCAYESQEVCVEELECSM